MLKDREEAGELLAKKLEKTITGKDYVVAPLLRGGIILGKKISDYFKLPLKPIAVKKLGAPLNPELGIGAVAFDKTYYFNERLIEDLELTEDYKQAILEEKHKEAKSLQKEIEKKLSAGGERISWKDKNVIVIDDGVATGNTVICASLYFRKQKVKKIILAIPVIAKDTVNNINKYFDQVVCLKIVEGLSSVGEFYEYFPQVETDEVIELIKD